MKRMANSNNDGMLKSCRNDCFEKMFKSEIFTTNEIDSEIYSTSIFFFRMGKRDKKLIIESLEEASAYNKDFSKLESDYLFQSSNGIINLAKFQIFITSEYPGYYYRKAIFSYVIRFILMSVQLLLLYLLAYPKNICIAKPFEKNDKKFWTFMDKKYKVIIVKRDRDLYLRTIIFFLIFFSIYVKVLFNLQRIKANKCLIIIIQISKYFAIAVLIIKNLYYIAEKNYCKNNDVLEIFSIIYDVIKYYVD